MFEILKQKTNFAPYFTRDGENLNWSEFFAGLFLAVVRSYWID